jgi:hypothetical protein
MLRAASPRRIRGQENSGSGLQIGIKNDVVIERVEFFAYDSCPFVECQKTHNTTAIFVTGI